MLQVLPFLLHTRFPFASVIWSPLPFTEPAPCPASIQMALFACRITVPSPPNPNSLDFSIKYSLLLISPEPLIVNIASLPLLNCNLSPATTTFVLVLESCPMLTELLAIVIVSTLFSLRVIPLLPIVTLSVELPITLVAPK